MMPQMVENSYVFKNRDVVKHSTLNQYILCHFMFLSVKIGLFVFKLSQVEDNQYRGWCRPMVSPFCQD